MPQVSLQHIIGTVALIGLIISTGLFYTVYTTYVQDDNRKKELGQISENVAVNFEEMINLAKFSKYSTDYMVKIIDLPLDVGGRAYEIQLMNNSKNGLYVHAFLATQNTVSSDSTIPYNAGGIPLKLETTENLPDITAGADNLIIARSGSVYGKNGTAIWASLDWSDSGDSPNLITIGIGWVEAQQ